MARPGLEPQERPPEALRQGIGQDADPVGRGRRAEIRLAGRHGTGHRDGERHRLEPEAGVEGGAQPVEAQGDEGRDPLRAALGAGQAEIEDAQGAVDPVQAEAQGAGAEPVPLQPGAVSAIRSRTVRTMSACRPIGSRKPRAAA